MRRVHEFLKIPFELEKFIFFGILQCMDAFLHIFTFLPLRLLDYCFGRITRGIPWTYTETCDLLKLIIIISGSMLIREIDFSVIYHQIRSQDVVNLVVIYNMLGVADGLLSSSGQDLLGALFWSANIDRITKRDMLRILVYLVVAISYATLHALLVVLQATTLNVAFNSKNQPVMKIMMSSNFVEFTRTVFKKFVKSNLFQITCSDVRERFHHFALLLVVIIRNMTATNWSVESLLEMSSDIIMIIVGEYFVDWFKHAFLTKFNGISSSAYKDFMTRIAFDVISCRDPSAPSDFSDQVSRRMGFIPIPLSIMIIRVLSQTFSFENHANILIFFIAWLVIFAVKIVNKKYLVGQACQHVKQFIKKQARDKANEARSASLIDFNDVLHHPVTTGKGSNVFEWEKLASKIGEANIPPQEPSKSDESMLNLRNTLLRDDCSYNDPKNRILNEEWDDETEYTMVEQQQEVQKIE